MLDIEFLLTRKCNQECYYCNNSTYCNNQIEVDLDYFKYVLSLYYKLGIKSIRLKLSGGEPGIVSNIEDLVELSNNLDYVKRIFILSNGTLRKRFNSIQTLIGGKFDEYHEHAALDISNKDILYFDRDITFFNSDDYTLNTLILTDITLNSLLNNFDYFSELGLFNRNMDFKLLTPKVSPLNTNTLNLTKVFYKRLLTVKDLSKDILTYSSKSFSFIDRCIDPVKVSICAMVSGLQYIDLENRKIGQCSAQVKQSQRYDITEDNIKKALQGDLFTVNDFCKKCIKYADLEYHYVLRKINYKRYLNKYKDSRYVT